MRRKLIAVILVLPLIGLFVSCEKECEHSWNGGYCSLCHLECDCSSVDEYSAECEMCGEYKGTWSQKRYLDKFNEATGSKYIRSQYSNNICLIIDSSTIAFVIPNFKVSAYPASYCYTCNIYVKDDLGKVHSFKIETVRGQQTLLLSNGSSNPKRAELVDLFKNNKVLTFSIRGWDYSYIATIETMGFLAAYDYLYE